MAAVVKDASALDLIDLPLARYTLHPYGVEVDAFPLALDRKRVREGVIIGWEVWCESTDMRPKCRGRGHGRANYSSGGAVYMNAIPCPECE